MYMKRKLKCVIPLLFVFLSCGKIIEGAMDRVGTPTLLFTDPEIDGLKDAVASSTGSLKTAFDNLLVRCENGLSFTPQPYTGSSPTAFYDNARGPAGMVRTRARGVKRKDDRRSHTKPTKKMGEKNKH